MRLTINVDDDHHHLHDTEYTAHSYSVPTLHNAAMHTYRARPRQTDSQTDEHVAVDEVVHSLFMMKKPKCDIPTHQIVIIIH